MMMMSMIWKRVIINQSPLSKTMAPFVFAFTVKSPNFCTQIASLSTTPPGRGVVMEFIINKCGLTEEEVTKAFRYDGELLSLRRKSTQNMEKVLELLKGCGLNTPAQIRKVVLNSPTFFSCRAERNIQSKLSLLRTVMKEEDIAKLLIRGARIFHAREDKLKSSISLLQKLCSEDQALSNLIATQPRLLVVSEERVLASFKVAEDLGCQKGSKMFAHVMRSILDIEKEKLERRMQCLRSLGFSENQVLEFMRRWPSILGYSEENVKHHADFLVKSVGFSLDDLVQYGVLFGLSLEKRLIPRYRVMEALKSMQVLKTERISPTIFKLTEKRFLKVYVNESAGFSNLLDIYQGYAQ